MPACYAGFMPPLTHTQYQSIADQCDALGEQLYSLVDLVDRGLAIGVLSAVIAAAEQIRGGVIVGGDASDMQLVSDAEIGFSMAKVFLRWHRGTPAFEAVSRELTRPELAALFAALKHAERPSRQYDESIEVMLALPTDIEAWLAETAEAARLQASPEELARWGKRAGLEVGAELLTMSLRAVYRPGTAI